MELHPFDLAIHVLGWQAMKVVAAAVVGFAILSAWDLVRVWLLRR